MAKSEGKLSQSDFDALEDVLRVLERPEVQPHHVTEDRIRQAQAARGKAMPERTIRNLLNDRVNSGEIIKLPHKLFDPKTKHWVNVYEPVKDGKAKPKQQARTSKKNRRSP